MNKQTIKETLKQAAKGREVITSAEFAEAWGFSNGYARRRFLKGLQRIGGRYLIDDVAERMAQEIRI